MRIEIAHALRFITFHLYSKLPRRKVNMLAEELLKQLRLKYQNHWHVDQPSKGSGFRSLKFSLPKIDRILHNAAKEVGLDEREIIQCLPVNLMIWIDPGEVSYREGERGQIHILYKANNLSNNSERVTKELNPMSTRSSDKDMPLKLDQLCISDYDSGCGSSTSRYSPRISSETQNSRVNEKARLDQSNTERHSNNSNKMTRCHSFMQSPLDMSSLLGYGDNTSIAFSDYESSNASLRSSPTFTTASFAQTKFGSTKLKNAPRRYNHLPSQEFSEYIKRRSQQPATSQVYSQLHHSDNCDGSSSLDRRNSNLVTKREYALRQRMDNRRFTISNMPIYDKHELANKSANVPAANDAHSARMAINEHSAKRLPLSTTVESCGLDEYNRAREKPRFPRKYPYIYQTYDAHKQHHYQPSRQSANFCPSQSNAGDFLFNCYVPASSNPLGDQANPIELNLRHGVSDMTTGPNSAACGGSIQHSPYAAFNNCVSSLNDYNRPCIPYFTTSLYCDKSENAQNLKDERTTLPPPGFIAHRTQPSISQFPYTSAFNDYSGFLMAHLANNLQQPTRFRATYDNMPMGSHSNNQHPHSVNLVSSSGNSPNSPNLTLTAGHVGLLQHQNSMAQNLFLHFVPEGEANISIPAVPMNPRSHNVLPTVTGPIGHMTQNHHGYYFTNPFIGTMGPNHRYCHPQMNVPDNHHCLQQNNYSQIAQKQPADVGAAQYHRCNAFMIPDAFANVLPTSSPSGTIICQHSAAMLDSSCNPFSYTPHRFNARNLHQQYPI